MKVPDRFTHYCGVCGLVREVNEHGVTVWPEPWARGGRYCKQGDQMWMAGTPTLCPEHYAQRLAAVRRGGV